MTEVSAAVLAAAAYPEHAISSRKKAGVPQSAASEVQGIYPATGTVTSGTFALGNVALAAGGVGIVSGIPYNATGAAVAAQIVAAGGNVAGSANNQAQSLVGNGGVVVPLAFGGTLANASQPLMTVDSTGLVGGTYGVVRLVAGTAGDFAGAAVGDPTQDSTTGLAYQNQGSAAAPIWSPPALSIQAMPSGNDRIASLGDSITKGIGTDYPHAERRDYLGMLSARSKGRFVAARNAGVASDSSTMILARLHEVIYPTDPMTGAAMPRPRYCVVLAGINDIQALYTAYSLAATQANLIAIWTGLRKAGVEPIACLLTPISNNVAYQPLVSVLNAWIWRYCTTLANPIKVVDFYSLLLDPATSAMKTAYDSGDHIHPNYAGADLMGQCLLDRLVGSGTYAHMGTFVASCAQDWSSTGASLFQNGNFLTDTNSDGLADGWTAGSNYTPSLVATTAPDLGNYQQIVTTGASSGQIFQTIAGAGHFVAGDHLCLIYDVTTTITGGTNNAYVQPFFSGAPAAKQNYVQREYDVSLPVGSRQVFEFVVPPGATGMNLIVNANSAVGATIAVGQMTLLNLTTMGLT